MNKDKTIFISIAAYNEIYIEQTIENALLMAKYPDRLRFGVFSLNSDNKIPSLSEFKNTKLITAQYHDLLGVCSSRVGAIFLYKNEDFYMQIDAHMLFDRNWDEILVNSYYTIVKETGCKTPLITTRTAWWYNGENNKILRYNPDNKIMQSMLVYDKKSYLKNDFPLTTGGDFMWKENEKYHEHYIFSAHFAFTSASFIFDIMPDINFYFYGEEQTTGLRAWTRGYRMFFLPYNIIWHYNKGIIKENNKLSHEHIYSYDRINEVRDNKEEQKNGIERTRKILTGEILGYWGSPTKELLEEYQKKLDFNFKEFYKKRDEIKNK